MKIRVEKDGLWKRLFINNEYVAYDEAKYIDKRVKALLKICDYLKIMEIKLE